VTAIIGAAISASPQLCTLKPEVNPNYVKKKNQLLSISKQSLHHKHQLANDI